MQMVVLWAHQHHTISRDESYSDKSVDLVHEIDDVNENG
jgi:hypothetical protein